MKVNVDEYYIELEAWLDEMHLFDPNEVWRDLSDEYISLFKSKEDREVVELLAECALSSGFKAGYDAGVKEAEASVKDALEDLIKEYE